MRKWWLIVVVASLVMAVAAMASDPWKEKVPEQWSQSEVQKILHDSPWARAYEVMPESLSAGMGSGNMGGGPGSAGASTGGGGRRGRGGDDTAMRGRPVTYVAQWYSSRTIRAAQLRKLIMAGSTPAADHPLLQVPDKYQVVLQSAEIALLARLGEEGLKKSSYLEMKTTHQRVAPTDVVVLNGPGGRPIGVAFEFPKKTAAGEPVIATDEKNIDFVSGNDDLKLKFKFDLGKMIDQKGTDL